MKNLLIFVVLISSLTLAQNQQDPQQQPIQPQSKLGKFISKEGTLLVKEFLDTHTLSGNQLTKITFQGLKIYSPGNEKDAIKGLKVTLYGYQKEASAFLDIDEIESVEKAMQYIFNEREKLLAQKQYTEIVFSAREYFKFGCYTDDGEIILFASIDKYPYPSFRADFDQLNSMRTILNNYLKILAN